MNDQPECTDYAVPVYSQEFAWKVYRVDWSNVRYVPDRQAFQKIDTDKPAVTEVGR